MTCWYQRMVSRKPSRNAVEDRNPNSFQARSTLSLLRGWPSGLVRSQTTSPSKPGRSTTKPTRSLIEIPWELAMLTGSPHLDRGSLGIACFEAFADERRDHVRVVEVDVVARPVEIDGQQVDAVEAVLLAVRLGLHEQHLLRQAVRSVGLLRVAVPEVLL